MPGLGLGWRRRRGPEFRGRSIALGFQPLQQVLGGLRERGREGSRRLAVANSGLDLSPQRLGPLLGSEGKRLLKKFCKKCSHQNPESEHHLCQTNGKDALLCPRNGRGGKNWIPFSEADLLASWLSPLKNPESCLQLLAKCPGLPALSLGSGHVQLYHLLPAPACHAHPASGVGGISPLRNTPKYRQGIVIYSTARTSTFPNLC